MNDTMPDGADIREPDCAFEPFDKQADGRFLVQGIDPAMLFTTAAGLGHDPPGLLQPDPLDPTGEALRGRIGPFKERELETRRSTVDRQDARGIGLPDATGFVELMLIFHLSATPAAVGVG